MRISDWSSDVCSSDLPKARRSQAGIIEEKAMNGKRMGQMMLVAAGFAAGAATPAAMVMADAGAQVGVFDEISVKRLNIVEPDGKRSEERRGGKEGVSPCKSRWVRYH